MILAKLTTDEEVVGYVNRLVRQCSEAPSRVKFVSRLNTAMWNFEGRDQELSPVTTIFDSTTGKVDLLPAVRDEVRRVTMNRIQNIVVSMMAIQTADPPKITFVAREHNDTPLVFLNTDLPEHQQFLGMTVDPTMPLDPMAAEQIKMIIAQSELMQSQAAANGQAAMQPILPRELLIEVNDQAAAEMVQTIFDGWWDASNGHFVFVENVLNKCNFGWQPTYYRYDPTLGRPVLCNPNVRHVFVDAEETDATKGRYEAFDELVAADDAYEKYPDFAEDIIESASTNPTYPDGRTYEPSEQYSQTFYRDMAIVRHCWVANQPIPMSPDEALDGGHVQMGEIPTGEMQPLIDDFTGQPALDLSGQPVTEPATRQAMMLPDGLETDPTQKQWPRKFGIRYICVVGRKRVKDEPWGYQIMPMAENVNTPIPFSRLGQGEPERLSPLQDALDRVITALVGFFEYNAFPIEVTTGEIQDSLSAELQNARVQPRKRIAIREDLVQQYAAMFGGDFKKAFGYLDTPTMSADAWRLLEFLLSALDKEGHQAEVIQGESPSGRSGEAIEHLQSAATQVIRAKAQRSEFYLKHLARLFDADIRRLSPEEARKWCGKWPVAAFQAIHQRMKQVDLDYAIEIKSGSGAAKQGRTQQLIVAKQAAVPVPDDMILESMDIDPQTARQQNMQSQMQQATVQAASEPKETDGKNPVAQ